MYPYQNQPSSPSTQQGPSSSQQFLGTVETAASRFKKAFGRKRPSRAGDDDHGTQSDAPSVRKMTPVSRMSTFMPRKDPKSALQAASSSFQALGQQLNKPLPPRVTSQIGPPPDLYLPDLPPTESNLPRKSEEPPRISHSHMRSGPVSVPVNRKPMYRTSQLVEGPEISAAIEYMLDSPSRNSTSPPLPKALEQQQQQEKRLSPPSPKAMRSGSFGNETTTPAMPNAVKRRSMSLSMMPSFQPPAPSTTPPQQQGYNHAPPSSFNLSPPVSHLPSAPHHRSHSTLPAFTSPSSTSSEPSFAKTDAYASGIISHTNPDKSSHNFKGKLAAWSSPTPSPTASRSSRNTSPAHSKTSSMVASIGPAATAATGMAVSFSKRAYEKVNSMWGPSSASTASSSSSGSPGAHPSQGHDTSGVSRMKSRLNGNGHGHGAYGGSFSDVETSRRRMGPPGGMEQPIGPNLGTMLRPPFRRTLQGGGLVFGRPLVDCVRDTKPLVVVGDEGPVGIEARFIPALVLRCVQHIEHWGITEEGLFRISGRTSHINKLRSEFASGADYDLQICGPGDLDPHAVASVLKAFLRELPEPILTRAKAHLYDAAFERAKDASFMLATSSAPSTLGYNSTQNVGLPSGPRSGLPSGPRDTATLPSRNRHQNQGLHPDPQAFQQNEEPTATPQEALDGLVSEFHDLTSSLPRENRDLLMTITELLQKAAGQSRTTKMPLSNLLLVLCPSMSMNPGVLKIFVEHHQAIFAEPKALPKEPEAQAPVEQAKSLESSVPESETVEASPPPEQPIHNEAESNPVYATAVEESREKHDDMLPSAALPVRKQSLRRLAYSSQGLRTTPTSSPSAYRETFVTEAPSSYSDPTVATEVVDSYGTQDSSVSGQPRTASTPTSPLQQSFSASEISRPAQPVGPRGPRSVPAPLALRRERSNTPERRQTPQRPRHVRSASSVSTINRDAQSNSGMPAPIKVEESAPIPGPPEVQLEAQPISTLQSVDPSPPPSQGNDLEFPSLPDMQLEPPLTSSFTNRRVTMPIAHPSPGLSDIPSSLVSTPRTADSGMSEGNSLIVPSLPEFQSLAPMTSSFANRRSAMPMARNDHAQPSPASLNVPSPDSARSAVQPLTPLLAAMEKEHASNPSGLPPSPDPTAEELGRSHPKVEPLVVIKKHASNSTQQGDGQSTFDLDSAFSSASSATSDATNIFDRQLSWPDVPKTIPVPKPAQNVPTNQPLGPSTNLDPGVTDQYVMAVAPTAEDLTATIQSKFPDETDENDAPVSPVVANGQYPPEPYPSVPFLPLALDDSLHRKNEATNSGEASERPAVSLPQPHAHRISSGGLYNAVSSAESTMRPMRAHAPRLTVNSHELLSGNSFWANELQRALRSSSPTSQHEARHSAELSSMLEAAGT